MTQFNLGDLRFILDTEDSHDKPGGEELIQQLRINIEALFILAFDTGQSGSATQDPPDDTTGVLTDANASYDTDEHNGRTLLITSGTAKHLTFTIDDTTATTLVCTGDNLYNAGVRSGDTYKILYDVKVNTDGHDHNGVNSPVMGAGAVSQAALKTDQGSVNTTSGANLTLPGGEYGFYPQARHAISGSMKAYIAENLVASGSYSTNIYLLPGTQTSYAQQRYVTSSGEIHWVFILRDKTTKGIISMWQAPDHPCFGNGGKPQLKQHPFGDYDSAKHEIVVITPSKEEVDAIRQATVVVDENLPDKDFLEAIFDLYEIDEVSMPAWPDKEITVGLPPDWDEAWLSRRPVQPIKKMIPKPDYVLYRSLKEKAKVKAK